MLTPSLTLTEQVARQIAADIAQGVHPVGAKLPSGRVLAEQYGVNAAVIREVTERLRAGLIQSRSAAHLAHRRAAFLSDNIAASRNNWPACTNCVHGTRRWRRGMPRCAATTPTWPPWPIRWRGWAAPEDPEQGVENDISFHLAVAAAH